MTWDEIADEAARRQVRARTADEERAAIKWAMTEAVRLVVPPNPWPDNPSAFWDPKTQQWNKVALQVARHE